jgi:tetratricopeptide (TPR) repeat protein
MPRATVRQVASLPQSADTWIFENRKLQTWVTEPGQPPVRPNGSFLYSLKHDVIVGGGLELEPPTVAEVFALLLNGMANPADSSGLRPQRPLHLGFSDQVLAEAIQPRLAPLGVGIQAMALPDMLRESIGKLEADLRARGGPDVPGLLSVRGVTPELVGGLFAAAADFYLSEPWLVLEGERQLAVRVPPEPEFRYTHVLGNAGIEYGLSMFRAWEDMQRFGSAPDGGEPWIPPEGLHSLLFDDATLIPLADLDGVEAFAWPLASPTAIPLPMVYKGKREGGRPSCNDLRWYEAALWAIPVFIRNHLKPDGRADFLPAEVTFPIACHSGQIAVTVRYPAREIDLEAQPVHQGFFLPEEREPLETPPFDRRALEGGLADLVRKVSGPPAKRTTKLQKAQDLMYQAWDENDPAQRLVLAHRALALSPDCADAYVLLAEEEADTIGRAQALYLQGVEAGERALGKRFFAANTGDFWALLQTRPYMRALEGLAGTLWRLGRREEALAHYRQMLRLNPGDNQGMRYLLLELLFELERMDEVQALLREYKDETLADFGYARALVEFQRRGPSAAAVRLLRKALRQNPHVPAYLTRQKRVPGHLPDRIDLGGEREAAAYAAHFLVFWRRTPGAVDWLVEVMDTPSAGTASGGATARTTRKRHLKRQG